MSATNRRSPRRVGDVLPGVAAQLGLERELRFAQAATTWSRLVEELVPQAPGGSRVLEIDPPRLVVTAPDTSAGQELRLRSQELLEAFAATRGGMRLLELRVVVRGGGARTGS